jgi:phosphate transport system permease protein
MKGASSMSADKQTRLDMFKNNRVHLADKIVPAFLFLCAGVSVLTLFGIIYALFSESVHFFKQVPVLDFITGTKWFPLAEEGKQFGVLPLLAGTFLVTVIACLVSIPIGLGSAIYLSEYASDRVRKTLKPILEILAGVPTIVYGYFALSVVSPFIQWMLPETSLFNALSAGIVMGIMIIPMISSLSEDAMNAVPRAMRNGAYGLGATKFEVATKVVVPAALSGIIASFVLGFSRAIGETMIVTVAAGGSPVLTLNPLESIQTMTAYIVQVSMGDVARGGVEYGTIYAVGLTLFLLTLLINVIANYITKKFREEY